MGPRFLELIGVWGRWTRSRRLGSGSHAAGRRSARRARMRLTGAVHNRAAYRLYIGSTSAIADGSDSSISAIADGHVCSDMCVDMPVAVWDRLDESWPNGALVHARQVSVHMFIHMSKRMPIHMAEVGENENGENETCWCVHNLDIT